MTAIIEHIFVVGAMATGKTTVGRGIAEQLGRPFIDSDDQIRAATGREGADIARVEGVDNLHQLELQMFWDALDTQQPAVIAVAASVIEDEEARTAIGDSLCVWVNASEDVVRIRRSAGSHRREVTDAEARRLAAREPLFASCADVRISTDLVNERDAVAIAVDALGVRSE
jgi:shikimate kinase